MEDLNNVPSSGTFGAAINEVNSNFSLVVNAINSLEYATTKSKGIYNNGFTPNTTTLPNSVDGDWCMVLGTGNTFPATIWTFNGTTWSQGGTWNPDGINLNDYATTSALNTAVANSLLQATARMGYCEATISNTTIEATLQGYLLPSSPSTGGGNVRVKMPSKASVSGTYTLNINSTGAKEIMYNRLAVSPANTWDANEVVVVYYTNNKYWASNSQGGSADMKVKNTDADLDFADEQDNVVMRLSEGHVKTKNFDSRDFKTFVGDENDTDLDFTDEQDNVILRLKNGHIKTKNFDSSKNEAIFKYTTIRPSLIGGNSIASTGSQGSIIAFGTLEANAVKYVHSKLYNVLPDSIITFNCDINTVEVKAIFYTDEYALVSANVVHNNGDSWDDCSINVPSTASMVIFQLLISDGNGNFLNNCNLSVNLCLNSVKPTSYFPRPDDSGYQHLTMKVGFASCIPNSDTPTNQLEVETSYYPDHGVLCLPSSYTPNGEPTRLICFTHGHAVTYNQNSTRFHSLDIKPEYWLSEGYAIFDMDGSITGTFSGNHDYEPAAVNSYDTAYEWIIRHFNIRTDGLFSTGRSQGGGMQFVLAKRSKMPILAFAPIVPFVSPIGYFNRAKTRSAKKELLSAYGVPDSELNSISWSGSGNVYFHQLTTAQKNMIINNQYRFNAYTAFCYNRPLTVEEADLYSEADIPMTDSNYNEAVQNVKYEEFYESVSSSLNPSEFNNKPFIMFTCVTDNAINHRSVELFHKLLSNAGQLVQIHVFPQPSVPSPENSDHRFEINTENMVTYTNSKGITLDNVPKVYIEILAFWRKFENQDQNINN